MHCLEVRQCPYTKPLAPTVFDHSGPQSGRENVLRLSRCRRQLLNARSAVFCAIVVSVQQQVEIAVEPELIPLVTFHASVTFSSRDIQTEPDQAVRHCTSPAD